MSSMIGDYRPRPKHRLGPVQLPNIRMSYGQTPQEPGQPLNVSRLLQSLANCRHLTGREVERGQGEKRTGRQNWVIVSVVKVEVMVLVAVKMVSHRRRALQMVQTRDHVARRRIGRRRAAR